ncbi:MAG: type IX secretion system membrane protein PorP/SprF [Flavobacteriaceae bacterium]|nr:type IX secretion system membrane protein PorP/SprF [Flavobacteriaceae bacterium]
MFSQQDIQYTQYTNSMTVLNPAYAGSRNSLNLTLLNRSQWTGVEGAPKTLLLSGNVPVNHRLGLGLSTVFNQTGPTKETSIHADFSYKLRLGRKGMFAFGVKTGLTALNINLSNLPSTSDFVDPSVYENIDNTSINFGVGVFYYTNNYYLGLSAPNIIESYYFTRNNGNITTLSKNSTYYIIGGYVMKLNSEFRLKGALLARKEYTLPLSIEVSANVIQLNKFDFGLSYRLEESINAMINLQMSRFYKLGYSYGYTVANIGISDKGSHEIIMTLDFPIARRPLGFTRCF